MRRYFRQLKKEILGAIQKTGLMVVLRQFAECQRTLRLVECWPGDEILMNTDGALHLTTPAKQAPKSKMRFDGFSVHLQHLGEQLDSLVRLLVEQLVYSTEIVLGETAVR